LARGVIVSENSLYNCGYMNSNLEGAITVKNTEGVIVNNNLLRDCYCEGINFYYMNLGFTCTGNQIIDVQDTTETSPSCIIVRSTDNRGVISGNSLRLINASLNTYVSKIGVYIVTTTNTYITIGPNYSDCTSKLSGCNGMNIDYGTFGRTFAQILTYNATPEGAITAPIGSLCINTTGGAGTTLYVKESGASNTGWIGK
jgi:hypothetical protein